MERWNGHQLEYSNLKVFGCVANAHTRQDKLDARAKKHAFLGYPPGVKGFKSWSLEPGEKKCFMNRDVVFDETKMRYPLKIINGASTSKNNSDISQIEVELEGLNTQANDKIKA